MHHVIRHVVFAEANGVPSHSTQAYIGLEVGIKSTHNISFGTVIKITPKGFIDVSFTHTPDYMQRFDNQGEHSSGGYVPRYGRDFLIDARDARALLEHRSKIEAAVVAVNEIGSFEKSNAQWNKQDFQNRLDVFRELVNKAQLVVDAVSSEMIDC